MAAVKSAKDKMIIKNPIEERYSRCSKIISRGMKVDSMARFKKNHSIPKEIKGLVFVVLRANTTRENRRRSEKKVAGGEKRDSEIRKSCSRLSRPGSGNNNKEI